MRTVMLILMQEDMIETYIFREDASGLTVFQPLRFVGGTMDTRLAYLCKAVDEGQVTRIILDSEVGAKFEPLIRSVLGERKLSLEIKMFEDVFYVGDAYLNLFPPMVSAA